MPRLTEPWIIGEKKQNSGRQLPRVGFDYAHCWVALGKLLTLSDLTSSSQKWNVTHRIILSLFARNSEGEFPGSPRGEDYELSLPRALVQSLFRELRPYPVSQPVLPKKKKNRIGEILPHGKSWHGSQHTENAVCSVAKPWIILTRPREGNRC